MTERLSPYFFIFTTTSSPYISKKVAIKMAGK